MNYLFHFLKRTRRKSASLEPVISVSVLVVVKLWTDNHKINNYRISCLRKNLLCNLYTFCCISLDAFSQNGIAVPKLGNNSNLRFFSRPSRLCWIVSFRWAMESAIFEQRNESCLTELRASRQIHNSSSALPETFIKRDLPVRSIERWLWRSSTRLVFTCYLSSTNTSVFHFGFPVKNMTS